MFKVSVVIPAQSERIKYLKKNLSALSKQKGPWFELIIVSDGSSSQIRRVLEDLPPNLQKKLVITEKFCGISIARNEGILHSEAPIIAFLDDDAIPVEGWLKAVSRLGEDVISACRGPVLPQNQNSLESIKLLTKMTNLSDANGELRLPLIGCNMAFKKEVFKQIGLFNTEIKYGHEELEIADRLKNAGYKIGYYTDMVVLHDYARSLNNLFWKFFKQGETSESSANKPTNNIFNMWLQLLNYALRQGLVSFFKILPIYAAAFILRRAGRVWCAIKKLQI
jgi:cellulose synthase/poly-beta-1,6-N-acetylglucosamine synthase-like glycosyltransferase